MKVIRTGPILSPQQSRVLLRPFVPGDSERVASIVSRIMALPEDSVVKLLDEVIFSFSTRHQDIRAVMDARFKQAVGILPTEVSHARRLLIGSYFLAEYSLESAALFNPSMVPHMDQSGLPPGALRFILSLRATGEGHISSIVFRSGVVHSDNRIEVSPSTGFLTEPRQVPNPQYEKPLFERSLIGLGLSHDSQHRVMSSLGETFTLEDLRNAIQPKAGGGLGREEQHAAEVIWMLARSNYEVQFRPDEDLCERVIFPTTPAQRNGIEDARFVRFQKDDGSHVYFATFTAFDGTMVVPELLETADFLHFRFLTLNGPAARNKGMAMFPRKIGGRFAMLSRQDNENIYLMFSENVHFWNEAQLLLKPKFPWELVQIGNCGSPIETEAGWLVLSHGVGMMREYSIGAFLLDRADPSKVIGRLTDPLLTPNEAEREGYVPNVVYSCGGLVHNGDLIIPYGAADHSAGFATVPLRDVLSAMR